MSRRASPRARTIRIAPTVPCVPVDRGGAPVPRSYPPDAGPVTGETAPARAWKVDRSVAQGRPGGPPSRPPTTGGRGARAGGRRGGLLLAVAAFAVYSATQVDRYYDHFVWQAAAFLEGQAAIRYPVARTAERSRQRVLPGRPADRTDGRRRARPDPVPAAAGARARAVRRRSGASTTDDQAIFTILAAVDVAICWWMLGRLRSAPVVRAATTVFFAFGTVFWYTAQLTTTWYQAHIVAVGLAMLAVGLARSGTIRPPTTTPDGRRRRPGVPRQRRRGASAASRSIARQFAVGLLVRAGLHGPPDGRLRRPVLPARRARRQLGRRGWSAGLGAAIPVVALLAVQRR